MIIIAVKDRLLNPLTVMIVLGLGIRMILMPLLTSNTDMSYWVRIVNMIDSGIGLYDIEGYYYTPPWGFLLSAISACGSLLGVIDYGSLVPILTPYTDSVYSITDIVPSVEFCLMVKIPLVLTDLAIAILLYKFVKEISDEKKALFASALWFLSPLTIVESAVHGMFDNVMALALLFAFIFVYKRSYVWAGAAFSLSILIKFFPIFLTLPLIALVLRKEGLNKEGFVAVVKAIAGAIATLLFLELPYILNGKFWDSLNFLISRIGLSSEFMESLFTPVRTLVFIVVLVALLMLLYRHLKNNGSSIIDKMKDVEYERKLTTVLKTLAVVFTVLILVYSVFTTSGNEIDELFNSLGMKAVMILSVYTVLIEIYLSYKLLFTGNYNTKRIITLMMLSAAAIFLWPPAPQYAVVLIPFFAVYCSICNKKLTVPVILFMVFISLYELVLMNITVLFTLADDIGIMSVESLIPFVEFITSNVFGIPVIGILMVIFGGLAYAFMLNIPYKWYKSRGEL